MRQPQGKKSRKKDKSHKSAISCLDEEVIIQERLLEGLLARRELLKLKHRETLTNIREKQKEVEALRSQEMTLQASKTKHLELQTELQQKLERCEERLARFDYGSWESRSPPRSSSSDQAAALPQLETETIEIVGGEDENEKENNEKGNDGDEEGIDKWLQDMKSDDVNHIDSCEGLGSVIPKHPYGMHKIEPFQSISETSIMVMLVGGIKSVKMISMFLRMMSLETLALDSKYPDGKHRRQSLFNTCLWASIPEDHLLVDKEIKGGRTSKCPIEIDNDNGSEEKKQDEQKKEKEQQHRLDPNVSICPYELFGECADPYCPYQHLKPRLVPKLTLTKEMLRLPDLILPELLVSKKPNKKRPPPPPYAATQLSREDIEQSKQHGRLGKSPLRKKLRIQSILEQKRSTPSATVSTTITELDFEDDFLALPALPDSASSVATSADENDSLDQDLSDTDADPPPSHPGSQTLADDEEGGDSIMGKMSSAWWMGSLEKKRMSLDDDESVKKGPLLIVFLALCFRMYVSEGRRKFDVTFMALNHKQTVLMTGKLFDVMRVLHHAGRFDLFKCACSILKEVLSVSKTQDEYERLNGAMKSLVDRLQVSMLIHNSHPHSVFESLWETQMVLSVVSWFMRVMHECDFRRHPGLWARAFAEVTEVFQKDATATRRKESEGVLLQEINELEEEARTKQEEELVKESVCLKEVVTFSIDARQSLAQMTALAPSPLDKKGRMHGLLGPLLEESKKMVMAALEAKGRGCHHVFSIIMTALVKISSAIFGTARTLRSVEAKPKDACWLEESIESISSWFLSQPLDDPFVGLFFVPLQALRVSLLVSLQRYNKAQQFIESCLRGDRSKLNPVMLSDILWSQLIQLRATLPFVPKRNRGSNATSADNNSHSSNLMLSNDANARDHEKLSECVDKLGIHLNYLTVCGDRNLARLFWTELPERFRMDVSIIKEMQSIILSFMQQTMEAFHPAGNVAASCDEKEDSSLSLEGIGLTPLTIPPGNTPLSELAFPRSILLGGRQISLLSLCGCHLVSLPVTFGLYFPVLKDLDLSHNELTELPDSIGHLARMESLTVSENSLEKLPKTIGNCQNLLALHAPDNKLLEVPSGIRECIKLRVLDLRNNSFEKVPNLVLHLKNLHELSLGGNPL